MYDVVTYLIKHNMTISTMESCTGGLLASAITDVEGSSAVFKGGFVTYSNEAKVLQGVPAWAIEKHGVYSGKVAEEMTLASQRAYRADIGIGVTGTLGNPDPNNADSAPGEIYFAIAIGADCKISRMTLPVEGNSRHEMKEKIVREIGRTLTCRLHVRPDGKAGGDAV